jgi:ammonia channel protein AmtB
LLVFAAWSAALNSIPLLLLKGFGKLRIDEKNEDIGYDLA